MDPVVSGQAVTVQYRRGRLFTTAVLVLLALHALGFLVPVLLPVGGSAWVVSTFGLAPARVFRSLCAWQLVTYSMLYPSMAQALAFISTALFLVFVGGRLEQEWGTRRFLVFYAAMAAASGLARALPELGGATVLVGSLGVTCALLGAFGLVFRGERVWLWFSTVLLEHLVLGVLLILALLNLKPAANLLWLAGAVFGFLYARAAVRWGERRTRVPTRKTDRFSSIDLGD